MFAKKAPGPHAPDHDYQRQIDALCARHSVIDALIRSLEEYELLRIRSVEDPRRQTA